MANGERYVSIPEEILPVPPIDSLILVFKEQPSLSEISLSTGLEIYARWKDPIDVDNFYMWEAEGIYILNTLPELHESRDGLGNIIATPKDCCPRCYVSEFGVNTELRIFKDNLIDGTEHNELVVYIPDDRKTIYGKIHDSDQAVFPHKGSLSIF